MAKTPLQKIKTQLDKLNKLHEKEEAIVEKINEIIEEEKDDYNFEHEGTDCPTKNYNMTSISLLVQAY